MSKAKSLQKSPMFNLFESIKSSLGNETYRTRKVQVGGDENNCSLLNSVWTDKVNFMIRHGMGERNENSKRLENLCALKKIVKEDTIFYQNHIHEATWISLDHTTEKKSYQISNNKRYGTTIWYNGGSRNCGEPECTVRNKQWQSTTGIQERRNRCIENFEELLNRIVSLDPMEIKTVFIDLFNVWTKWLDSMGISRAPMTSPNSRSWLNSQ